MPKIMNDSCLVFFRCVFVSLCIFFVCHTSQSFFPNYFFSFTFFIHLQPKIKAIMLQNEYELNHIFMTTVSVDEIKTLQHIQMMQWSQPWLRERASEWNLFPLFFSRCHSFYLACLFALSLVSVTHTLKCCAIISVDSPIKSLFLD